MTEEQAAARPRGRTGSTRAPMLARVACVVILLLSSAFHAMRGAPVDAVIFGAAAAALLLDRRGGLRVPLRLRLPQRLHADTLSRRVVVAVVIAAAALVLGASPRDGVVDSAVVVGLGVVLLPVAWSERDTASTTERSGTAHRVLRRTAVLWAVVVGAGLLWEVGAYFLGRGPPDRTQDFPAISDLTDPVLAWAPARVLFVAVWLLGGYALIRRGHRR